MTNGSGIHFLMRLLFVSKNIFRQNVPVVYKESIMESAAYIWCRILQELQNSREIAQSEPLWESAEPICAENGVFALYIADREQRSLFLERFFDETERILHDTLNSESPRKTRRRLTRQCVGRNRRMRRFCTSTATEMSEKRIFCTQPPAELYSGRPGLNCYCAPATGSSMR